MARKMSASAISDVIDRNLRKFKKPGVLTVRPGYQITAGWITAKPAIVATVNKKRQNVPAAQRLPAEVQGVPVDVREATGVQRLRHVDPAAYTVAQAHMRPEFREPAWRNERDVATGKTVTQPSPTTGKSLKHNVKPQLPYKPPKGLPLSPVTAPMSIIAYATPDAQVTPLKTFLAATKTTLTVAMYDFTSAEILAATEAAIKPKLPFTMVLDHPPRNPTANQTDDVTRADLLKVDSAAQIDWALTRTDPVATQWIFPTAYHIKVAVRDSNTFWLSSGNFNVSNQPDFRSTKPKSGTLANSDRDWHLIITHAGLAKLFEGFILNDFKVASGYQSQGSSAVHTAIRTAMKKLQKAQNESAKPPSDAQLAKFALGKPQVFKNVPVTVQPLLTPDQSGGKTLYVSQVVKLISTAQTSVYMQTQYVHPSDKAGDAEFMTLIAALQDAIKRGLDVRLITSQYENTAQWLEKLKPFGLDEVLRIQQRVHNKGIVVDTKRVMVSSENWSADGTLRNRDAGVIIDSVPIATYFQAIFMDDWTNRAKKSVVDISRPSKTTSTSKKTSKKKSTGKTGRAKQSSAKRR